MSERKLVQRHLDITDLVQSLKLSALADELRLLDTPDKVRPFIDVGNGYLNLIWYEPENDEEYNRRNEQEARDLRVRRMQYEALKKEFEE